MNAIPEAPLTLVEARRLFEAIIDRIPTEELPKFTVTDDGCIWFENLSMGWNSATNPLDLGKREVYRIFAAEAAGRELHARAVAS